MLYQFFSGRRIDHFNLSGVPVHGNPYHYRCQYPVAGIFLFGFRQFIVAEMFYDILETTRNLFTFQEFEQSIKIVLDAKITFNCSFLVRFR